MAAEYLLLKVKEILKAGSFRGPNDMVDVSEGDDGGVHIVVVSRKLDGLRYKGRCDLIWNELQAKL